MDLGAGTVRDRVRRHFFERLLSKLEAASSRKGLGAAILVDLEQPRLALSREGLGAPILVQLKGLQTRFKS